MNHRRRPKYLFSGLTRCACCGGGYSAISATLIGCSTARNKGACDNRTNIRREELEARMLNALRTRLVDPELFARFCEVFTQEMNRLRMDGRAGIAAAEAEMAKINRELDTLLNLILKGGAADAINSKMVLLERRKKELALFLAEAADASSSNFERDIFRDFRDICWHDRERCRHRHHDPAHARTQTFIPTITRIRRAHTPRNRRSPPILGSSRPSTYAGGDSAILC